MEEYFDLILMTLGALVLLLAAGWLAEQVEKFVFTMHREKPNAASTRKAMQTVEALVTQRRAVFAKLRLQQEQLDRSLDAAQKESNELKRHRMRMTDPQATFVVEMGYPGVGVPGFYVRAEGPALMMPYTGFSSAAGVVGGRRFARAMIWGLGPAEAQKLAENWAGEDGRLAVFRPFTGQLKPSEV